MTLDPFRGQKIGTNGEILDHRRLLDYNEDEPTNRRKQTSVDSQTPTNLINTTQAPLVPNISESQQKITVSDTIQPQQEALTSFNIANNLFHSEYFIKLREYSRNFSHMRLLFEEYVRLANIPVEQNIRLLFDLNSPSDTLSFDQYYTDDKYSFVHTKDLYTLDIAYRHCQNLSLTREVKNFYKQYAQNLGAIGIDPQGNYLDQVLSHSSEIISATVNQIDCKNMRYAGEVWLNQGYSREGNTIAPLPPKQLTGGGGIFANAKLNEAADWLTRSRHPNSPKVIMCSLNEVDPDLLHNFSLDSLCYSDAIKQKVVQEIKEENIYSDTMSSTIIFAHCSPTNEIAVKLSYNIIESQGCSIMPTPNVFIKGDLREKHFVDNAKKCSFEQNFTWKCMKEKEEEDLEQCLSEIYRSNTGHDLSTVVCETLSYKTSTSTSTSFTTTFPPIIGGIGALVTNFITNIVTPQPGNLIARPEAEVEEPGYKTKTMDGQEEQSAGLSAATIVSIGAGVTCVGLVIAAVAKVQYRRWRGRGNYNDNPPTTNLESVEATNQLLSIRVNQ